MYDGHAVSLWCKSTQGIVADEPHSTGLIGSVKKALLKMLGWRILQGFQSLFHFLKKRCFHRLLREYPTDSLL